jgi:hypothetical protein
MLSLELRRFESECTKTYGETFVAWTKVGWRGQKRGWGICRIGSVVVVYFRLPALSYVEGSTLYPLGRPRRPRHMEECL